MGKGKLAKFADMEAFENVFQYPFSVIDNVPFEMKGHWRDMYFNNSNPIVLELGCGRGEYAVGLARKYPDINFIGVDIKGARMWTGAKQALDEGLKNVAFLRTNIEIIDRFFDKDEVQQIWLTFSDPQMKHVRKRLTSTTFMTRYRRFMEDGGLVHVKTDSNFLYTYTRCMAEHNQLPIHVATADLYHTPGMDERLLSIQTSISVWVCRARANSPNPMWRYLWTSIAATTARSAAPRRRQSKHDDNGTRCQSRQADGANAGYTLLYI